MHPENNIDNKDASSDNGASVDAAAAAAADNANTNFTTTTITTPNNFTTISAATTTTTNNIATNHTTPTTSASCTESNNVTKPATTTNSTETPNTTTTNTTNSTTTKKATTKKASTKKTTATTEASTKPKPPVSSQPRKRKSRSASNESSNASPSPKKRVRKKKTDQPAPTQNGLSSTNCSTQNMAVNPMLSSAPSITVGSNNPLIITAPLSNSRLATGQYPIESFQDSGGRYYAPVLSSYNNIEPQGTAPSLSRSSLSRLFTTSSLDNNANHIINPADDPTKAFEELRDEVWSSLSRNILDQAQKFDIPSMFGLLYTIRSENEKLVNKVRDLKMKLDQMIAVNARLDLPGPMLTQHLNQTSPNFSSVVSSLTSSPRGLTSPSSSSVIGKPMTPAANYNHLNSSLLVHPGYLERNSPLINQANNGLNNLKPPVVSAPSPPRGSLLVHSNNSNRPGLMSAVSSPYTQNAYGPK